MQSIYAAQHNDYKNENDGNFKLVALEQYGRLLNNFEQTIYYFVAFWTNLFDFTNRHQALLQRQHPNLSQEALGKMYNSVFFQSFLVTDFAKTVRKHTHKEIDPEWMHKIYQQAFALILASSESFKQYCKDDSLCSEPELIESLWRDIFEHSEIWDSFVEEYIPHGVNDDGILVSIIKNIFDVSTNPKVLIDKEKKIFGDLLIKDTIDKWDHISTLIKDNVKNWEDNRLTEIDAIILKMGICEILYYDDIPTAVTINEYVDIAKMYSGVRAGNFINGILDAIAKQHNKKV